jgi:hypothetical protein
MASNKNKKAREVSERLPTVNATVKDGIVYCPSCEGIMQTPILDYGLTKDNDYYFIMKCIPCHLGVKYLADVDLRAIDTCEVKKEKKKPKFKSKGNIFDDFDGFDV